MRVLSEHYQNIQTLITHSADDSEAMGHIEAYVTKCGVEALKWIAYDAAREHGNESEDTDLEIADLQDALEIALELMTEEQRGAFLVMLFETNSQLSDFEMECVGEDVEKYETDQQRTDKITLTILGPDPRQTQFKLA